MTATPASDRVVGAHRLLRLLGRGGMGEVWEAVHLPTRAPRAVKLLGANADADLRLRFQREGEAQARVGAHPHVARVHAAGTEPDGTAWLAMDLLGGGDLRQRLRAGPISPRAAAELVAALARGLEHVHALGVLHRDLKPENVLFDAQGSPHLADFGLARLAEASGLTRTGAILGTPAYAAPEQLDGSPGAVSTACDVYGLGALLYECLTGRAPFVGKSLVALLRAALSEPPTPPRELAPDVPPELEALALRALQKDPARRPSSAGRVAAELERWLAGERPSAGRGRLGLAAALLLAALVVAGASLLGPGAQRDRPEGVGPVDSRASSEEDPPAGPVASGSPESPPPPRDALAELEVALARMGAEKFREEFAIATTLTAEDHRSQAGAQSLWTSRDVPRRAEESETMACLEASAVFTFVKAPRLAGRYLWLAARSRDRPSLPRARLADHMERSGGGGDAVVVALELAEEAAFLPGAGEEEAGTWGRLLVTGKWSLANWTRAEEQARRACTELPGLGAARESAWARWLGVAQLRTLHGQDERRAAVSLIERYGPAERYRTAALDRRVDPYLGASLGAALCRLGRVEVGLNMLIPHLRWVPGVGEGQLESHVRHAAATHLAHVVFDGDIPADRIEQVEQELVDSSGSHPATRIAVELLQLQRERGPIPLAERIALLERHRDIHPVAIWLNSRAR